MNVRPSRLNAATGVPSRAVARAKSGPAHRRGKLAGLQIRSSFLKDGDDLVFLVDVIAQGDEVDSRLANLFERCPASVRSPPTAFSALAMTRSIRSRATRTGRARFKNATPGWPTISPRKRIRIEVISHES